MIYIHIPFCHRKCSYCAFYSVAGTKMVEAFADALVHEMEQRCHEQSHPITTLYIGGGTPSVLPQATLARIVDALQHLFDLTNVKEATIECNPEDLSEDYLRFLRNLNLFNRLSIGIQSFDNAMLRRVGRRHSSEEASVAVKRAAEVGFRHISIDLMYGLPGLTDELWEQTIRQALALPVDHISAYALSIEPGTAFSQLLSQGRLQLPSEDAVVNQYHTLCATLRQKGFEQYEVSNFSLAGCHSMHNSRYWDGTPYLGLGPGAHSFSGERRRWNDSNLAEYIKVQPFGEEILTPRDRRNELIMTSLRCASGLPRVAVPLATMSPYIERGLITLSPTHYLPTEEGLLYADAIAADLFDIS